MGTEQAIADEVNELRGILRDCLPYLRNSITFSPIEDDRVAMAGLCETIEAHCFVRKPRQRLACRPDTRGRADR